MGKRLAKAERLCRDLRTEVLRGKYEAGQKFPSQNVLAERHGVSVNTAREAIGALVHEGLLSREHGRGTFVKEVDESHANAGRLSLVCVLPPREMMENYHQRYIAMDIFDGMAMAAAELDCKLGVEHMRLTKDRKELESQVQRVRHWEAVVFVGDEFSDLIKALALRGFLQVIAWSSDLNLPNVGFVGYDRYAACQLGTEQLVKAGRTRLGFVGGPRVHRADTRSRLSMTRLTGSMRFAGFLAGLETHVLPYYPDLSLSIDESRPLAEQVDEFCKRSNLPDGLFVVNPHTACVVLERLAEHGISVPGDMAVAALGDAMEAENSKPPLTVVCSPPRETGRAALAVALDMARNQRPADAVELLDARLIVRGSCGADSGASKNND